MMQISNKIHKLIQGLGEKQQQQPLNCSSSKLAQNATSIINDIPKQPQYPQEKSIIHCPASMVLLFVLFVEALAITSMQGCIIYYHTLVFAQCNLSLRTLGLSQVDLIYHGILIMAFVYQVLASLLTFLYKGILLVVYTGIQTIQHMMFEKAGCQFPPLVDATAVADGNTTTLPNLSNETTTPAINKLLHMSVIISNTSSIFQDTVDEYISNIKPFEYAILVLVPLCFIIMAGCIVKLYSLFKWNQYKSHTVPVATAGDGDGARLRMTLMAWSVLTGLLKLDFFFLFAYAVQLVPSHMMEYTVPSYESSVVFFASVLAFLLAIQGIRSENYKVMWLFSLVLLGSIGYLGYRLFTFGIPREVTRDPFMV
ncbi:hypothetical protein MAM1_0190c07627 [Mucor ambiguus]|uniref:Uncharacterized protein n=1 Tax=Mucor ambiguus TaxID=91626 RepID=A0A0C9LW92_9FUNG|nr:hypothetical protein MAM1_0190c07627 [Mucor ambiguus]